MTTMTTTAVETSATTTQTTDAAATRQILAGRSWRLLEENDGQDETVLTIRRGVVETDRHFGLMNQGDGRRPVVDKPTVLLSMTSKNNQ